MSLQARHVISKSLALSLSGGGHLLPYHLGVCQTLLLLLDKTSIRAVAGSSAGAIAAALVTLAPDCISDYADRFIQDGGRGLEHLTSALQEAAYFNDAPNKNKTDAIQLYICTTRCRDGALHLHRFDPHSDSMECLLTWIRASCNIPRSFHPTDVLERSGALEYPEVEGVQIGDEYYVDGGIAGPAPLIPQQQQLQDEDDSRCRVVVVSPISGSSSKDRNVLFRISPYDTSFGSWLPELHCRANFCVKPSLDNLRALRVAAGATRSSELQSWWQKGVDDAHAFAEMWNEQST